MVHFGLVTYFLGDNHAGSAIQWLFRDGCQVLNTSDS